MHWFFTAVMLCCNFFAFVLIVVFGFFCQKKAFKIFQLIIKCWWNWFIKWFCVAWESEERKENLNKTGVLSWSGPFEKVENKNASFIKRVSPRWCLSLVQSVACFDDGSNKLKGMALKQNLVPFFILPVSFFLQKGSFQIF